jgi:predicted dehydrogenase
LLSVFQSRRYDSDFRTVRAVLDSGELGEVHRFESRYERWRPTLNGNWRESPDQAAAGGLLYDLGAHLIDQFITLFGVPTAVFAQLASRRAGAIVDDDDFLVLQAESVAGQLWMSAVAADAGPRFRILGSAGAFVKYGMDPQEDALIAGRRPITSALDSWGREDESAYGRIGADSNWRAVQSERGDYADFYRAMASAMHDEGPVPVDPRDSVAGLRVIEAARKSASSGRLEIV